jgi:hypothetical protein
MDRQSKDATAIFTTQLLLNLTGKMVAQGLWDGDAMTAMIHETVRQASERNPDEFDAIHEVGQVFLDRIELGERFKRQQGS